MTQDAIMVKEKDTKKCRFKKKRQKRSTEERSVMFNFNLDKRIINGLCRNVHASHHMNLLLILQKDEEKGKQTKKKKQKEFFQAKNH